MQVRPVEDANWPRVAVGFVIAPAVPALLLYLLQAAFSQPGAYLFPLLMLMYAYPLTLILGVPAYFVFRRKGRGDIGSAMCVGAAIGLVGYLIDVGLTISQPVYTDALRRAFVANSYGRGVIGIGWGAISGVIFWFVTVRASGDK